MGRFMASGFFGKIYVGIRCNHKTKEVNMPNNEKGQQGQSHGNKSGSSEMDDKMKSGKSSQGAGNRNTGSDSGHKGRGGSDSGRSGGSSGRSGNDR